MYVFVFQMDQMFLTVRGVVHGSFMATLGVASVFVHKVLRPGYRAWRCSPTTTTTSVFFGVNLDYLDFSGGIFDLFYEPVREKTNNLGFRPGLTQTSLYSLRRW